MKREIKKMKRRFIRAIIELMEIEFEFVDADMTMTLKECIFMFFEALFILGGAWVIISGLIIICP